MVESPVLPVSPAIPSFGEWLKFWRSRPPETGSAKRSSFFLTPWIIVGGFALLIFAAVAVNTGGANKQAKTSVTKTALSSVDSALERYKLDHGAYPADLGQLTRTDTYLKTRSGVVRDGFKQEFVYLNHGDQYFLASKGQDGAFSGSGDDVISDGSQARGIREVAAGAALPQPEMTKPVLPAPRLAPPASLPLMIVKQGDLTIEIPSWAKAVQAVTQIASEEGGFLTDTEVAKGAEGRQTGTLTMRMRADRFEKILARLEGLGTLLSKRVSGEEITQEFTDLEARLKAKQRAVDQAAAIMQRSGKVSEILEVERHLESLIVDMETLKGRMRYLKDAAALSTLRVHLEEPLVAQSASRPVQGSPLLAYLGRTFGNLPLDLVRPFVDTTHFLMVATSYIIPLTVYTLIFLWTVWFFRFKVMHRYLPAFMR